MPSKAPSPAAPLVEALGSAWTVHGLYPDPEAQPAFRRAVETIKSSVAEAILLDVAPGGFVFEGEPVEVEREGADRLARRCYLQNLESIRVQAGVSDRDVIRFFSVLNSDEGALSQAGGVEAALMRSGIERIAVVQRALLKKAGEEEEAPSTRDPEVDELLAEAADPRSFAAAIVEEAGGDADVAARIFEERYVTVLGKVTAEDVEGRERVVQAFVESFFFLPEAPQLATFRRFLDKRDQKTHQVFLDQFAGHELARLSPRLDPDGFAALLDYARLATDQADRRPDELLALLQGPDSIDAARTMVAERIEARLGPLATSSGPTAAVVERLRTQIPEPRRHFYDALDVFRGLLHSEERDAKFSRLMRIWSGKVAAAVRRGEFRRAELWVRSALDHPTYPEERRPTVDSALDYLAESDAINRVLEAAADPAAGQASVRILQALGSRAVGRIIDQLGEAEEGAQRRALIDVLARLAAPDPRPVLERMSDPRWYVVRNLTIALGRTGNSEAMPGLERAFTHPDQRVRVEALRSIAALRPADLVLHLERGLGDSHEAVQITAIGYLTSLGTAEADAILASAMESGKTQLEVKLRLIRTLTPTLAVRTALERFAGRRFAFGSAARQLRQAARSALSKEGG